LGSVFMTPMGPAQSSWIKIERSAVGRKEMLKHNPTLPKSSETRDVPQPVRVAPGSEALPHDVGGTGAFVVRREMCGRIMSCVV